MIHLRPESTAYTRTADTASTEPVGGFTSPDGTILEGQNPSELLEALKRPVATSKESFKATLQESIAAKAIRGAQYASIPSEYNFNVSAALGESVSQYSADELEFLGDARSSAELAQRKTQVQATRDNYSSMGQNLLTTVAASVLDIDLVIGGGIGALTKVSRATRLAIGLAGNSAALGVASYGGTITPADVIGTSVGVALSAIPGVRKVTKVERAAAEETPTGAPATKATVQPDSDYPNIKLDTYSNKPHIEVGRTVSDAPEIVTDVRNAVNAVLTHGDDLPEGVRALGRALASSMDADDVTPVVFRKTAQRPSGEVTDVSFNSMRIDGATKAHILGTEPAVDLSTHVKGMSTYNKTILLHEAAHAKTMRSLQAVRAGLVTDGPVYEAAKRVQEIRQYVQSTLGDLPDVPKNFQVRYGLQSDDEFLAQLFNSPELRTTLQGIKMPGTSQSVFSELVQKVVSLFTGKAPTGSAFDETLVAFEKLLQEPAISQEVFLRKSGASKELASAVLNAPDVKRMGNALVNTARTSMRTLNKNFSLFEGLSAFGTKASALAERLVVDSTGTTANSAVHGARVAYLSSNTGIVQVDAAIQQALSVDWSLLRRARHPLQYREAQRTFSTDLYHALAEHHTKYLQGKTAEPSANPKVQAVVDTYAQSGWAEESLRRIKASGIEGAADIKASPYYLPRQHSGGKLNKFLRDNPNVTPDDIIGMYTHQFHKMYREEGITDATARKLGHKMYQNMQDQAAHTQGYRQSIAGMSYDDVEQVLVSLGAEDSTIQAFIDTVRSAGTEQNKVRNLRGRVAFDMTEPYVTKSGELIAPCDFVNTDVLGLMEGYSRRMSGRIGLAEAGFGDMRDLVKSIDAAASESTDPARATKMFDNTINQILGYPTGEDVPDILRSMSILGATTNLANSGVWQLGDYAFLLQQFGLVKTMKALGSTSFGRDALALAKSPEYGASLRDILEARHVLTGKYRSILTHLEDNTDLGTLGAAHQYIQKIGQGTRFANGMEYVRRSQVKLMAGLVADTVEGAIKGDTKAFEALRKFGLDDTLLRDLQKASSDSPDMRTWPDAVRSKIERVTHNMADSLVLENRLGEIPGWMQFSAVGKVVLPYMTYVAGSWNKILRRTAKLDGTTGVAMALAYQMPLISLSSVVALSLANKETTPLEVAKKSLVQVPLMSWLGYATDFAMNGPTANLAALSLVTKMHAAMKGIISGDSNPENIIKAVPILSLLPGAKLAGASMADDD